MGRAWLIKVNATIYNIFGSARQFGEEIPWHLESNMPVEKGDTVFFYLTDSKEREKKKKYSLIDTLFKRFLFEGEVLCIDNHIQNYDDRYWTDKEYQETIESKNHRYAIIKITKILYDYNITSDKVDRRIWDVKNSKKDAYELDSTMVSSIRKYICNSNFPRKK